MPLKHINPSSKPQGFVLASAIFLLVVLAAVGVFMLHLSTANQTTNILDLQGARAYQAARAGIERGLYQALQGGTCTASQTMNMTGSLTGFSVTWQCAKTIFRENGDGIDRNMYQITSTATYGVVGNIDYVERQLVVTTEN